MRMVSLVFIFVMFAASAQAAQECGSRAACRAECRKIEQKISRIHARMRSGYGVREGEKMQAELRRLRKERLRTCR